MKTNKVARTLDTDYDDDDGNGVGYDTRNQFQILFKLHGSVWRNVMIYCLLNVSLTYGIIYFRSHLGIDLYLYKGHAYMNVLISFLVVQRCIIVYNRYMEARGFLGILFKSSSEFMQHVSVLTIHETSDDAKEWRRLMALEVMKLLNVTTTFLSFRSGGKNIWDSNELDVEQRDELRKLMSKGLLDVENASAQAPILLVYDIRKLIARHEKYLRRLDDKVEISLQAHMTEFTDAYYGLKRLIMMQFPFPLVQMARTFLFFYVYTLPFELVAEMDNAIWSDFLIIFFLTYGYVGIELVSMEMDDPFGDDPNDFKHAVLKNAVFEDIYLIISDSNGTADARGLRHAGRTSGVNFEGVFQSSKEESVHRGHRRKPTEVDDFAMSKNLKSVLDMPSYVRAPSTINTSSLFTIPFEDEDDSN